jgi:hypothetical protein
MSAEDIGYFALAKRNLETGAEQVQVVATLPTSKACMTAMAYERDKLEDAHSDWRWFVVQLTDEEVVRYQSRLQADRIS